MLCFAWYFCFGEDPNKRCDNANRTISLRLLALILCSNCSESFNKDSPSSEGYLLNYYLQPGGSLALAQHLPAWSRHFTHRPDCAPTHQTTSHTIFQFQSLPHHTRLKVPWFGVWSTGMPLLPWSDHEFTGLRRIDWCHLFSHDVTLVSWLFEGLLNKHSLKARSTLLLASRLELICTPSVKSSNPTKIQQSAWNSPHL